MTFSYVYIMYLGPGHAYPTNLFGPPPNPTDPPPSIPNSLPFLLSYWLSKYEAGFTRLLNRSMSPLWLACGTKENASPCSIKH